MVLLSVLQGKIEVRKGKMIQTFKNLVIDTYTMNDLIRIMSIAKFSIMIRSPRAYLSRNRRDITWVIGARFNGILRTVFYNFLNL